MADTLREKIIAHIFGLMENYTSYVTIEHPEVSRGRQLFDPDNDVLPVIAVLPRPETSERTEYRYNDITMPIDINCLVRMTNENPSELGEAVLGELISAAFASLPSDAYDVVYAGGGIDQYPDQMGQSLLAVGLTINVRYETRNGDPYN